MKKNSYFSLNRKKLQLLLIMKIIFTIIILSINLSWASSGYSQNDRLSVNIKQKSVREVFAKLEKASGYRFFYNDDFNYLDNLVSVDAEKKSLNQILDGIFKQTDFEYKILDNKLVVVSIKEEFLQNKEKITGRVTDQHGEPLYGVTVSIKGTQKAVLTGTNGGFSIEVIDKKSTLVFSYIGFITQEHKLAGEGNVNIALIPSINSLDEVVVVGYGKQKKVNLSGAVASVSSDAIGDRPVLNVAQALEGAVGNLNITIGNGQANASPTYNIRGYTSINGGSPLIVIDGIVADGGRLNDMNPNDIETVTVLKDASASAIYGSRAAYGVILVTTKSAKQGKQTITYSDNFSFRTPVIKPQYLLDPSQVANDLNTMATLCCTVYDKNALDYAASRSKNPSLASIVLDPTGSRWIGLGNTDWYSQIFKNYGASTQHNLSISGNTDKATYMLSGGFEDNNGMLKVASDTYKKYNFLGKVSLKLKDWWSISNSTSYVNNTYDRPYALSSDSWYFYPTTMGTLEVPYTPDGHYTSAGVQTIGTLIDGGRSKSVNSNYQTQFETNIDILKDVLYVQGHFSYYRMNNVLRADNLPVSYMVGPTNIQNWGSNSTAYMSTQVSDQYYEDVFANFHKTFAGKHYLGATLGVNQESYRSDYLYVSRTGLITPSYPTVQLATGTIADQETISTWAMRSTFGRLNYTFDNKYIVEFSGRDDGTSRFPSSGRWAFNPSASAAWVMSNEKFFKPLSNVISFLKFRASYGTLGNQNTSSNYPYLPTMSNALSSVILDGARPYYVTSPGLVSGSLTWEKVTTANLGVDINFLNNRLTMTGDIYQRDTKGMLSKGGVLPNVLGASQPLVNAANLSTKGWELMVSWKDNITVADKPFNYNASFVLSDNKAKITKYNNPTGTLSDYYVGENIGEIWGLTTQGFFTSADDIAKHANQNAVTNYTGVNPISVGDLKFLDKNNDGVISKGKWTTADHGDYSVIGNTTPRYNFGINLGANWNGFDISMFFQGVGKKDFYPAADGMATDYTFYSLFASPWAGETVGFTDHWTPTNTNAYFPRMKPQIAESSSYELGIPQTRYLQNAAYIRLKNLTIGYTIPTSLLQKYRIDKVRIFFSGENLWTKSGLSKDYPVDPELVGISGGGGLAYTLQKSYSFGLTLSF
jgi:TonB-linked SusC/RagA family outer membrane protein